MASLTAFLLSILFDHLPRLVLLTLYATLKFLEYSVPLVDLPHDSIVDAIRWSNRSNQWCPFSIQTAFHYCQAGGVMVVNGQGMVNQQESSHYSLPPMNAGVEDVGKDAERQLVISGMDSMEFIEEKMDYVSGGGPLLVDTE